MSTELTMTHGVSGSSNSKAAKITAYTGSSAPNPLHII